MNRQLKRNRDGSVKSRGIEWTDYTWNPIGGCLHACQWTMPDGTVANCYAGDVATRLAGQAYPEGFEHHYWRPQALAEPGNMQTPSKIFAGSMADVFGHWVPEDQIEQVLDVCREASQHTFQLLTKNPKRMLDFNVRMGENCWRGASTPPDFMWNKPLTPNQKERMLRATLAVFGEMKVGQVTWLSAEPLSWDIVPILEEDGLFSSLNWVVIGAASNGPKEFAPDERHVRSLVEYCDDKGVKVFFKGNLRSLPWAAANWREDFPQAA